MLSSQHQEIYAGDFDPDEKYSKGRRQNVTGVRLVIIVIVVLVLVGLIAFFGMQSFTMRSTDTEEGRLAIVREILTRVPLIDGHNDFVLRVRVNVDIEMSKIDMRGDLRKQFTVRPDIHGSHTDIARMKQGMMGGQFWSVFVHCDHQYKDATERGLEQLDLIKQMITRYSDYFEYVTESDGIMEAFKKGKLASLIGLESGHIISDSPAILRSFYDLGVRYMTLTWNCNNVWVDYHKASTDTQTFMNGGLSDWGKLLILEMNRLGMIVDLSHVSRDTMRDVLDITLAPVMFSHSSAYTLCPHSRNVPDDILQRLPLNQGIVMVNFCTSFINCSRDDEDETKPASLSQVADHIEHMRAVAGVDHIGIGSDYDGIPRAPVGLEDVSKYPYLFAELIRRGWTDEDLEKLAGLNIIRVMKQVEEVRDSLKNVAPMDKPVDYKSLPDTSCMNFNFVDYI